MQVAQPCPPCEMSLGGYRYSPTTTVRSHQRPSELSDCTGPVGEARGGGSRAPREGVLAVPCDVLGAQRRPCSPCPQLAESREGRRARISLGRRGHGRHPHLLRRGAPTPYSLKLTEPGAESLPTSRWRCKPSGASSSWAVCTECLGGGGLLWGWPRRGKWPVGEWETR